MGVEVGWVEDLEDNYRVLVIMDTESGDTLELQRSIQDDEQDRALGMDTYCFVHDGATHYGGLKGWRVESGTLTLRLKWTAARVLGLPRTVKKQVTTEQAAILKERIPVLLA